MNLKYNAFISYRHAEQDSKIASEVQTQLERFRIPKEIVKKTGVKRFERIFRDKEELPITSDLNDDIDMALANSDNLIVICSTRTGESIWVRKEIETFLKYHDKSHIFTVLVDGNEPTEVIPDILQHNTVTVTLPDGRIETREEIIEPLSCDYRIGIKKARKVELPRLAASMLGVSYDEIIQRRRQYIRRRNSIIGCSAALMLAAIIGYLTWSLLQIKMNYNLAQENYTLAQTNFELAQTNFEQAQANYEEALRNQSAYLASESGELLNEGDRLGAVQLALAALPTDALERPVTSEAEYALSSALGMYRTPGLSDSDAVWNYGSGFRIDKFRVDHKNLRVAALDALGNLNIWSLKDHTLIKTFVSTNSRLYNFVIDPEGRVALGYTDKVIMMDSDLETELWSKELDYNYSASAVYDTFWLSGDGSEIAYYSHSYFIDFDSSTGEILYQFDLNDIIDAGEDDFLGIGISRVVFSPDDSQIAIVYAFGMDSKGIAVFDRETEEWSLIGETYTYIPDISFSPDSEKLVFTYEDSINDSSFSFSGIQVLRETNRLVDCYDVETGKLLWSDSIAHTLVGYESGLMFVNYGYEGEAAEAVAVSFSNRCVIIDMNSGEKLTERELLSEYIDAYVNVTETKMYFILRNGQYMVLRLDDPGKPTSSYSYFAGEVLESQAYIGTDGAEHYLIKCDDSNYLTEYSSLFYDTSYNPITETGNSGIYRSTVSGKYLLAVDSEMNLYCVDMNVGKAAWNVKLAGDNYTAISFVGNDELGNVYMINSNRIDDEYGDKLYKIDISDGDISQITDLPETYTLKTSYSGGCIYISYSGGFGDPPYILKYNLSDGSSEKIELNIGSDEYFSSCDLYVSEDGKHAVMVDTLASNGITYLADLENGNMITLDITGITFAAWSPDSKLVAISNGEVVCVYQSEGPKNVTLSDFETNIADVYICGEGIIVLLNNGRAGLYDEDGNLLRSLDAFHGYISSTILNYEDTIFRVDEDILTIQFGEYSSIIYLDEFKVKDIIAGLLAYDQGSARYYVRIYGNVGGAGSVGYFNVRSIEELIAEGLKFIGDETMSDEMKKRYGIED